MMAWPMAWDYLGKGEQRSQTRASSVGLIYLQPVAYVQ